MRASARRWVSKFRNVRQHSAAPARFLPFPGFRTTLSVAKPAIIRRLPPKIYGQMGDLEVVQAQSRGEVKRAQKLRYKVFYEEMSAIADAATLMNRRDKDPYDPVCDHLLVMDKAAVARKRPWPAKPQVVGTYRLLRQSVADRYSGFYSQGEFDIASLVEAKSPEHSFVELGRSCVLKPYRNKRTLELLWQGVWNYVREHGADVMIGCASFEGTDPSKHAKALSFLHHNALAPEDWRARAHDHLRVDMDMMPASEIDMKSALKALPPLIKGYLRVGAFVGDGAVVDHQFGTTDVLMIMPIEAINQRYFAHFGMPNGVAANSKHLM